VTLPGVPDGDPYTVDGFDGEIMKKALNISLNAEGQRSAEWALAKKDLGGNIAESEVAFPSISPLWVCDRSVGLRRSVRRAAAAATGYVGQSHPGAASDQGCSSQ